MRVRWSRGGGGRGEGRGCLKSPSSVVVVIQRLSGFVLFVAAGTRIFAWRCIACLRCATCGVTTERRNKHRRRNLGVNISAVRFCPLRRPSLVRWTSLGDDGGVKSLSARGFGGGSVWGQLSRDHPFLRSCRGALFVGGTANALLVAVNSLGDDGMVRL